MTIDSTKSSHEQARVLRILEDVYVRDMYVQRGHGSFANEFADCFQMLAPEIDGRTGEAADVRWVGRADMAANHPKAMHPNTTFGFPWIEIVGDIAVARIEVAEQDVPRYTDLVCLHRVDGAWQIVSKLFHRHLV